MHKNNHLAEKNIKNILKPFYTTKPTGLGTGLGLYLVSDIIKKHNGEITVQTEEDVYTEFQIIIPLNFS